MELLDLPQLANHAGLPISLARYYRDRFIMFVPSVRIGRTILHPFEAADALKLIAEQARQGSDASAIEDALETAYPVTVITSQEVSGEVDSAGASGVVSRLVQALDERGSRVESELTTVRERVETLSTSIEWMQLKEEHAAETEERASDSNAELEHLRQLLEDVQSRQASLAS